MYYNLEVRMISEEREYSIFAYSNVLCVTTNKKMALESLARFSKLQRVLENNDKRINKYTAVVSKESQDQVK